MRKQELRAKLHSLYGDNSKHSVYQNIPGFVKKELDYNEEINEDWRGDTARYRFLMDNVDFQYKVVGDFGANTGFFSLSLAFEFQNASFIAYEMNPNHVDFMESIKRYFDLGNFVVEKKNLNLSGIEDIIQHDILLNFNVLHHAGVDFDKDIIHDEYAFRHYAEKYLAKLKTKTRMMVFQMGFNWGGNKKRPIVSRDSPDRFITYLKDLCLKSGWSIDKIFVHDFETKEYENVPVKDEHSQDKPNGCGPTIERPSFMKNSEFFRRPVLLLR
jgi:hypothetical protein